MVIAEQKYFRNKKDYVEFLDKGWFVIPDFLSQENLKNINDILPFLNKGLEDGFYQTNWTEDKSIKTKVYLKVSSIFQSKLKASFSDVKPIYATLIHKQDRQDSVIGLHQDWSVVDESRFSAFNVWCPLQTMPNENGCLRLVSGSHKKYQNIRGQNIPDIFVEEYLELEKNLQTVVVEPGDALVFNQRLIHTANPNLSGNSLWVAMTTFVPKKAQVRHYFRREEDPPNKVAVFACDDFFYLDFDLKSKPKNAKLLGYRMIN